MLAQVRAIATGKESVTESIIRSVAKDSLRLAQPILSALKTGDIRFLQNVEDVHASDITSFLEEAQKSTKIVGRLRSSSTIQRSFKDGEEEVNFAPQNLAPALPATEALSKPTDITTTIQTETKKRQIKRRKTALEKHGLMRIVSLGAERKVVAYEALKQEGFIRAATEYLLEEVAG
jgi:hypothetical protein